MNFLPKIKQCPACSAINVVKVNGIVHKNEYKSLSKWIFKKIINCRRCKIELGLFYNSYKNINKLFWIDLIKCEDNYYDQLINLQENKIKYKKNFKKYNENEKEIIDIQNKIRLEKIKLKIKFKIQTKGMLVRHVY